MRRCSKTILGSHRSVRDKSTEVQVIEVPKYKTGVLYWYTYRILTIYLIY